VRGRCGWGGIQRGGLSWSKRSASITSRRRHLSDATRPVTLSVTPLSMDGDEVIADSEDEDNSFTVHG